MKAAGDVLNCFRVAYGVLSAGHMGWITESSDRERDRADALRSARGIT